MLPDCECKGRAFLHSLQEIAEKKCEKISFAPILPLHSIAKSAVKPIFSPLPHPTFFAPKSPFFPLFPFRTRFRAIFRWLALVFCPAKPTFFSSCLVLGSTSDDFSRDLTLYLRHTALFAQREGFFISYSPHSSRPAPPSSPDLLPFRPSFPLSLHYSPTFFLFPPHFSISLPNKRTNARTLARYARTRTPAPTRTSGDFRLLPSPLHPPFATHCTPMR